MAEQAQKEPTMEEILSSIRKIIADDDVATESTPPASASEGVAFGESPEEGFGMDVFADLEAANGEDDFEPEMPKTTDEVLEAMQDTAAHEFADDADSFAIEDHESDEMADIMEFIDFNREPEAEPQSEPVMEPAELEDSASFLSANDAEDVFHADAEVDEPEAPISFEAAAEEDLAADALEEDAYFNDPQPEPVETPDMTQSEAELSTPLTDHSTVNAAAGSLSKLLESVEFGDEAGGNKTIDGVVKELLRPMLKEWLDENLQGLVDSHVEAEIRRIGRRAG